MDVHTVGARWLFGSNRTGVRMFRQELEYDSYLLKKECSEKREHNVYEASQLAFVNAAIASGTWLFLEQGVAGTHQQLARLLEASNTR